MPPALDKTVEKDHRIQISSRDVVSNKPMDTRRKPEDGNPTRLWVNLSSLPALDFCSIKSLLEVTKSPASYGTDLQPGVEALLRSVSMDKSAPDCPLLNKDSSLKNLTASTEVSRTVFQDHQSSTKTHFQPCLLYFQRSSQPLSSERSSENMTSNQSDLRPEWHVAPRCAMQEKVDTQRTRLASQLHQLTSRTNRAKLRLHAMLGENVLQTINKQLEEFKGKLLPTSTKTEPGPCSPSNALGVLLPENVPQQASTSFNGPVGCQGGKTSSRKTAESVKLIRGLQSLVWCGRAVLCRTHQNLDSDVTESNSSDEDWDEESERTSSGCLGCEWTYQRKRSKLASQWTWMKLRLSELDAQIKRLSHLHHQILTNKEGVVLAEAQPLTDLQIQQTLLTETAGLTLTAGQTYDLNLEPDTEPSSPTRLLRNIERQSAKLSQIVNSLMCPPVDSHSRLAKGDGSCWRSSSKRPFNSPGRDTFLQTGGTRIGTTNRRKRQTAHQSWGLSQVDVTLACARTRPLLTYHKPRLFIADQTPVTQQEADSSACRYSNSTNKGNRINGITNCTHKLQAAWSPCKAAQTHHRPRVKKRRPREFDTDANVSQSGTRSIGGKGRTEEVPTPHRTNLHQTKSQFPLRRRNSKSLVAVQMSPASSPMEKLQYKDIPTPSWRLVAFSLVGKKKVKMDMKKVESLSDQVFVQRHQKYECREKLCWSSCEKDRRFTLRNRFYSRTDASSDCGPETWTCRTSTEAPDNMEEPELHPPWKRRRFPLSKTDEEALRSSEDSLKSEDALCLQNQEAHPSSSGSFSKKCVSSVCAHTLPPAGQTRNNKHAVKSDCYQ